MKKDAASALQYAALPYRHRAAGGIEVMLITSRDTGRWVIPRGWPVHRLAPCDSAAREAREEAGLVGRITKKSIGRYRYGKRVMDETTIRCMVEVFALEIEQRLAKWPEKKQRHTRWFTLEEAAKAVRERELSAIIRNLAALLP